jgi:hypothetical protein
MRTPSTVRGLEDLGREQLSKSFLMREFLYSEISQIEGIPNVPADPDLAIEVGRRLCQDVLEPLQDRFGRISIRSAYRSEAVNGRGAENSNQFGCAKNEANFARHIWDRKDAAGMGAMACVVLTPYLPYFKATSNWEALAWWIHDHVPGYSELEFFTKSDLLAFNVSWHEQPKKTIHAWAPRRRCLTKPGMENHLGSHASEYQAWLGTNEA